MVIQEWWGLVDHIKDVCDRFAAEGFVALAPDLYHGKTTKSPDEAGKLMMALRIDEAERDLSAAVRLSFDSRLNHQRESRRRRILHGRRTALYTRRRRMRTSARVLFSMADIRTSNPICRT